MKINPLIGTKLDDANFLLAKGYATKENALEYAERWNRPGHRLTRLELKERVSYACGVQMLSPYLKQLD